jgi:hypothetical protein
VLSASAVVPAPLLAWLVTDTRLGELHKTLAAEPRWLSTGEHDAMRREAGDVLTAMGWRDGTGRLEREVAGSLAVLCRPEVEFYGWITHGEHTVGVLAGRIGKESVLAVRHPDSTVRLSSINSGRLAERLVAQLPDVRPGRGRPFTASASEVRAARRDGRLPTPGGAGMRRASQEVRLAQRLAALPTTGHGELSVARRDEWGRRRRAPHSLRYTDTSDGRFALLFPDGHDQVGVQPADRTWLVRQLYLMEDALSAPHGADLPLAE